MIKIKRIYEKYSADDGFRVLVDRLWPRGISKPHSHVDLWLKEIAPTNDLRKWFSHDAAKWKSFEIKYRKELQENKMLIETIKDLEKKHHTITLLFSAKDEQHNNAMVLQRFMLDM
ncbi:conserved hypothetical protein [Nitrosotalea sinensis]|uniref:Uroporphyrin-III C-methyltransferase n=1 Tax=Nitrosotalea sinensis TaxID=1499975 RepID=A0A2H1EEY6_9ARCH|nr:DUF488 family protein [Candidatus Nitrosotalea sinensis]SHO42471.1 conserved hypothetical protein [Candidatus Nitrosotalea sinensis]